jgi:DNA-binding transcriptional MerR regulator
MSLLSIKEVTEFTGLTPTQLRYWDRIGLVPAVREGRDRRYGPEQLQALATVKSLQSRGWTPREILALLEGAERAKEAKPSEDANAILRRQLESLSRGESLTFDVPDFKSYNSTFKRVNRESKRVRRRVFMKKDDKKLVVTVR